MKPTDPKVIAALHGMEEKTPAIYLGDDAPLPLAWAGVSRGQLWFFTTNEPQRIAGDLKATITPVGIQFRDDEGVLRYYVTPAAEAPERGTGSLMDAREIVLDMLEAAGGPEKVLKNYA